MDLKRILKYVNVRGLLVELLLKEVCEPALKKVVAESSNQIDDAALAMLLPTAEKALIDLVDQQLKKLGV